VLQEVQKGQTLQEVPAQLDLGLEKLRFHCQENRRSTNLTEDGRGCVEKGASKTGLMRK
jgi:hypothetical protein